MAFSYLGNPYKEQKSLSDYMAVNDARDLQQAQAQQAIAASKAAVGAAKAKTIKEQVGQGLILADLKDPEAIPKLKATWKASGVPDDLINRIPDAITEDQKPMVAAAFGIKVPSSGLSTIAGADGNPVIVDKTTGQYMKAREAGQPLSQMMQPQPTQQSAPVQTGAIQTSPVMPIGDPNTPSATMDSLLERQRASGDSSGGMKPLAPLSQQIPEAAGMVPPIPENIPDTKPNLSTTIQPTMTPLPSLPKPTPTDNPRADQAALQEWNKLQMQNQVKDVERQQKLEDTRTKAAENPNQEVSNSNTYAMRMQKTTSELTSKDGKNLDAALAGFVDTNSREVPLAGNYLVTPEYQRAKTLADNWITANLRKESGAAIPPAELKQEREKYFPIPGDDEANIKLKRELRAVAEKGMQQAAGSLWKMNQSQGGGDSSSSGGGNTPKQIKGDDDYNALPKGAVFIDPEGNKRTKP